MTSWNYRPQVTQTNKGQSVRVTREMRHNIRFKMIFSVLSDVDRGLGFVLEREPEQYRIEQLEV